MTDHRFCPRCGTPRQGEFGFCGKCGLAIRQADAPAAQGSGDGSQPETQPVAADGRVGGEASAPRDISPSAPQDLRRYWWISAAVLAAVAVVGGWSLPAHDDGGRLIAIAYIMALLCCGLAVIYGIARARKWRPRMPAQVVVVGIGGSLLIGFAISWALGGIIQTVVPNQQSGSGTRSIEFRARTTAIHALRLDAMPEGCVERVTRDFPGVGQRDIPFRTGYAEAAGEGPTYNFTVFAAEACNWTARWVDSSEP